MEGSGREDSANDFAAIQMSSLGYYMGNIITAAPLESSFGSYMGNNIDPASASYVSSLESSMENIDTGSVESDLSSSLDSIVFENSLLSTNCSIFETPKILFLTNEKAYVPTAFSIGPLHHGKPGLTATEQIKLKYMQDLISRVSGTNSRILKDMVKEIACLEEEARQCYAVPVEFTRDEFIKILLVDGCFLIELFCKYGAPSSSASANDPVMNRACMLEVVDRDLFLLENQIPWMVLDRLFSITFSGNRILFFQTWEAMSAHNVLTRLAMRFFRIFGTRGLDLSMETSLLRSTHNNESKHILDLLRTSLIGSMPRLEGGNRERWELIPSASSLIEAGVKFKKGSTDNGILDIKFSDGVLEIPPFIIHESTEAFFRNMISFEQCYHHCDPRITNYAMLLDILINTPKDIDILHKYGIIKNWLNPEKASQIFDNLYNDTYICHRVLLPRALPESEQVLQASLAEMASNIRPKSFQQSMGNCFASICSYHIYSCIVANSFQHQEEVKLKVRHMFRLCFANLAVSFAFLCRVLHLFWVCNVCLSSLLLVTLFFLLFASNLLLNYCCSLDKEIYDCNFKETDYK